MQSHNLTTMFGPIKGACAAARTRCGTQSVCVLTSDAAPYALDLVLSLRVGPGSHDFYPITVAKGLPLDQVEGTVNVLEPADCREVLEKFVDSAAADDHPYVKACAITELEQIKGFMAEAAGA